MIEFPNIGISLRVSRAAFSLFGIQIYWYGILITLGVILAFTYALRRAKTVGMISDHVFDTAFAGAIGGFVGARLYYVLFNLPRYTLVSAVLGIRDGGLAVYGGIIGGVFTAFVYTRIRRIRILPILDLAGPAFLIGQGIGRWGNFFNQEAFGAPTANTLPWGMTGTAIVTDLSVIAAGEGALVHPCFLYESIWCFLGLIWLNLYLKKARRFDGEVFLLYAVWYGAGRAFIESLRTDSLYIGNIKVSQLVAVASCAFALILFIYFRIKSPIPYKETDESKENLADYKNKLRLQKQIAGAKSSYARARKIIAENKNTPSVLGGPENPENAENKED